MTQKTKSDAASMLESLAQRQPQRGAETQEIQVNLQESKQASKQTNLQERATTFSTYLRPSLQKRIKRLAVELDRTTASLVEEALETFVARHEK
jgi:predicted DNA-binding protein